MDHDQFFKLMMRLFLRDFFEVFYPEWLGRLRFDQAEWIEQEIFPNPPRGEKLVVDILVKMPIIPSDPPRENEPRESVALILIEAEGSTRLADFRLRIYDYTKAVSDKTGLDVLPIAIFLSLRLDGRNTDKYERHFWERRILTFEYDYVALPGLRAEDYAHHPNPLAAAWSTMMQMERDRRALAAVEAMDSVVESTMDVQKKHVLMDFIQTYAPLEEDQRRDLNELLVDPKRENAVNFRKTMTQEAREEGETIGFERGITQGIEKGISQGIEKGISQGIEKGISQGIEKGQRELLLRLCQKKFKNFPMDAIRRQIETMSVAEFEELEERLLIAQSPQELGLIE